MKNLTKKCLVTLLALGMVAAVSTTAFAADVVAGDDYIQNEYVKITEQKDDFTIDTTGGDPDNANDDEKRLLYSGSGGNTTSDMVLSVDGNTIKTSADGEITVNADEKSITTAYADFNGVSFKRVLTLVANDSTGREDTVEVKFVVTNNDTVDHNVGAKIMLDTMLGENDNAPFRVPAIGAVTTRIQLDGDSIPAMFQVFDDLENPTVVATGSFATGAGRPDYVQFNNYHQSDNDSLDVECDTELSLGDSVVNSFWNPATLAAGESREYVVYYGLGAVAVSNESELVLGATKVEQNFELNEDETGYNPVSIMGYIKNSGDVELNNVELSIELPEGVSLVDSEGNVSFGTVAVNGENQTTWTLNAEPVAVEKEITVTIKAKSDETGEVTPITYTYTLPAIEMPTEPETEPETEAPTDEPTVAPTDVATQLPTVAPTNATKAPTQPATTATTVTTTTTTTTTTGKVATGDSMASIMLMGGLLAVSGTVVFMNRKRRADKAE